MFTATCLPLFFVRLALPQFIVLGTVQMVGDAAFLNDAATIASGMVLHASATHCASIEGDAHFRRPVGNHPFAIEPLDVILKRLI